MPLARSQKGTLAALLAALVGIAAGFLWLSNRIPCLDRGGVSTNILADQSLALVTATAYSNDGSVLHSDAILIDLRSGAVEKAFDERLFEMLYLEGCDTPSPRPKAHWLVANDGATSIGRREPVDVRFVVTELKTGKTLKEFPYTLNTYSFRVFIGDRFMITKLKDHFEIVDLHAEHPSPKRVSTTHPTRWIWGIPEARYFMLGSPRAATVTPPELYHVDENGTIRLVRLMRSASPQHTMQSHSIGATYLVQQSGSARWRS
ncbi:hypothetical protein Enr13x_24330 [Stieleria neptunia]|uniref:Uncharacterized protein n=1 Tax=Stieleria neptunia TaxID=2527979 RepID=A0A518HP18_9BACT|nr:hypothetical protein [Stieleria neptunia]QDV42585.1 hypothetical protein Enr13x_24330 [Stieleria neptunia]